MNIRRTMLASFLIGCLLFTVVSNNALAAEGIVQDEPFVLSTYSEGNMVYIVRADKTTSYNNMTGEVFDENGDLVGRLICQSESKSADGAMRGEETPPTSIQHGRTIGARWTYSISIWTDAVIYEKTEAVAETVVSSLVIAAGLAIAGITGGWNTFWSVFWAAVYADWNEKGPQEDSYYVHVRKYMYCNKYVMSDYGYVWQAYLEDYAPKAVLSYSIALNS